MKNIKRLATLCLALVLVMACSVGAFAADPEVPGTQDAETVASGECGENLTWTLDESGVLTISGTGTMWGSVSSMFWNANKASITAVIIDDGVTFIGDFAFQDCPNLALISLPDGLTSIGDFAFLNCTNLALTSLPSGLTSIGDYAFQGCTNLALTSLPDGLTSIGDAAFYNCTNLESITIPSGISVINEYTFGGCTNLTSVYFIGNAPSIAANAFSSVPLETLTLYYPTEATGWTSPTFESNGVEYNTNIWILSIDGRPTVTTQENLSVGSATEIPILVDVAPCNFKATVPMNLPVHVESNGTAITATNAKIKNESSFGRIEIKSITVAGIGDWVLTDYASNFSLMPVDSKLFGMSICGADADSATGLVDVSGLPILDKIEDINLVYNTKIAPQSAGLPSVAIANVVIVVGWN